VEQFVCDWYHVLDVHLPPAEAEEMVDMENVEFHIPEGVRSGPEAFRGMYHFWTHSYFDEIHTVEELDITPESDHAEVNLLVHWQAQGWTPPAAKSDPIDNYYRQSWIVVRDLSSGRPVIQQYITNPVDPPQHP